MTTRWLAALLTVACLACPLAAQQPDEAGGPLTQEGYRLAGVPDVDVAWGLEDYAQALDALQRVMEEHGPGALPRGGSPFFARLVSDGNQLVEGDDPAQVLPRRLDWLMCVRRGLSIYLAGHAPTKGYSRELTDLIQVLLRSLVPMLETVAEFQASLPEDDPQRAVRLEGLEGLRAGLVEMFQGTAVMLAETLEYQLADRERLADCMLETLPACAESLQPEHRSQLAASLRGVRSRVDSDHLRERIDELLAGVE
jgi:hypothetical protein